ncbi:unnamed protein product [Schistosoma margrebowiei]|uniref:Calcineurin-like phosphoesterase domain-containing protein n=1 Tax=Schistosoma margrebowiei TaxID=48269 RepID=A0A3P8A387_9TREM|nr:unnamed protein product [Schistosoma margrebowiei]
MHGELDCVYADIAEAEQQGQFKTDLVLCCGDFQAVRNPSDLTTMSVPSKYYRMGDFWRYYAEESRAPVLTLFVGGNHEASGYLQELPYGGWVAPNIWYMGKFIFNWSRKCISVNLSNFNQSMKLSDISTIVFSELLSHNRSS